MLALALALAVTPVCAVETAHYRLRHSNDVTISIVPVARSQDWPSGIAMALHNNLSGHVTYFLPWNGGSDGRQNVAHTTDVTRSDFRMPSPDGGPGRLGDMEYVGTDINYDIIDHIPTAGEMAPSHILLSGLSDASWKDDAIQKEFFDLDNCSSPANAVNSHSGSAPANFDIDARVQPIAPALTHIPNETLSDLVQVGSTYERAAWAHAKVIGAFAIDEPEGARLISASGSGYLPVTLSFSDGRCFSLNADYKGGTLSNGLLSLARCDEPLSFDPPDVTPATNHSLRFINSSWRYSAWMDDQTKTAIITAPFAKTFEPLFVANMSIIAMLAMNSPDGNGGNMTLVGRADGQLMVVTLEISF